MPNVVVGVFRRIVGWLPVLAVVCSSCATLPKLSEDWVEVRTEHLLLRTTRPADLAVTTAARLQAMRDVLAATSLRCAFEREFAPIEVTLLPTDDFRELGGDDVAGFYSDSLLTSLASKRGQIVMREDLGLQTRQVFQHELSHRLIATCFPSIPHWLNEGLASFLETTEVQGNEVLIGIPPYAVSRETDRMELGEYGNSLVQIVPRASLPPPGSLFSMARDTFYRGTQARIANYAAAWATVHYLELGDATLSGRWHGFLGALNRGEEDANEAWSRAFDGVELDARLAQYLDATEFAYVAVEYAAPSRPAPVARLLTSEEADLQSAWLWSLTGGERRTRALEYAKRASEHPSTRVEAHMVIALSQLASKDTEGARAELRSALGLEPNNANLLALLLEVLSTHPNPAESAEARSIATRLRPLARSATHTMALANYELEHQGEEQALNDTQQAVVMEPENWRAWLIRAQVLMAAEQWRGALYATRRASNLLPHGSTAIGSRLAEAIRALEERLGTTRGPDDAAALPAPL